MHVQVPSSIMQRTTRQVRFEIPRQLNIEAGVRTIHIDLSNIQQKSAPNNASSSATVEAVVASTAPPSPSVAIKHGTTRYVNGVLQTTTGAAEQRRVLIPPVAIESVPTSSKLKSCLKPTTNGQPNLRQKSLMIKKPPIASHTVYLVPSKHCKQPVTMVEPAAIERPSAPPTQRPPPRRRNNTNVITGITPNRLQVPLAGLSEDTHREAEAASKSSAAEISAQPPLSRFQQRTRPAAFGQFMQLVTGSWRGNGKVSSSNGATASAMTSASATCNIGAASSRVKPTFGPSTEPPVRARVLKRSDEKRLVRVVGRSSKKNNKISVFVCECVRVVSMQ